MCRAFTPFLISVAFIFLISCDGGTIKTHKSDNDSNVSDDDSEFSDSTTDENSDETTDETTDEISDVTTDETTDLSNDDTADDDVILETCGDKLVDEGELCDGNVKNCIEIDPELYIAGKAKCQKNCQGWNTETCEENPYKCGDEKVEGTEVCDGGLKSCVEIDPAKYNGGSAYCLDDCTGWDVITCDEKPVCTSYYRMIVCAENSSLDQFQTCSDGIWSDAGECLDPDDYALLEKDEDQSSISLDFTAAPDGTDILLIMDTSGSMYQAIDVLQGSIGTITSNIRSYIPDSNFGIVTLGTLGYNPFVPVGNITDNLTEISTSVSGIADGSGSYEYHTLTLEQSASGSGTNQSIRTSTGSTTAYNTVVPAVTCGTSLRGGVCFRENSLPVFILMTDEKFDTTGWVWDTGSETTIDDAAESMNDINAKIAVIDSSGDSKVVNANANYLAEKTDSYDLSGAAHYYSIPTTAAELNLKVEAAAKSIYDSTKMDVGIEFESVIGNTIDAAQFVKNFVTISAIPSDSIDSKDAYFFYGVLRETVLRYSISLQNTTTTPGELKFLKLKINAKWNGITLDSKEITLVIP